jgi:biopolymer transport protein ExbD
MPREDRHQIRTPMSALIDVVFLLLIYFAVTYEIERDEQEQSLQSGSSAPGRISDPSSFLTVLVTADDYQLPTAKRSMSLSELQGYLRKQLSFDPGYGVAVQVAPGARHGRVIALLDHCREVKCTRLRMLGAISP